MKLSFLSKDKNPFLPKGFTPLETTMKQRKARMSLTGFTLAELLLGAIILAFALTGLLMLFTKCILLNAVNRNLAMAASHAQYIMEELRDTNFSGLEAAILTGNWDLNKSQLESSPYELMGLTNEQVDTNVFESGNPLGVSVTVTWDDREQPQRNLELRTRMTNYQ